ncbi:MAG TPA: phosphoribosylformylglycinamidine synthase subunit PurS [Chthoniobacterales bacterium]|jgi:phosphoribosylformylglycinamidine synthase
MKATVVVMPKASVLDPQGVAVKNAVQSLGLEAVHGIRVGKYMEIELSSPLDAAGEKQLHAICRDLLSNPVIEDYRLEISQS